MSLKQGQTQLLELSERIKQLKARDYSELDAILRKIRLLIRHFFSASNDYLDDIDEIDFPKEEDSFALALKSTTFQDEWDLSKNKLLNLINTASEDLELKGKKSKISKLTLSSKQNNTTKRSNQIFIVHGTDYQPVKELKAILQELGLNPIILHEQPSKGLTIIEKLEEYSNVGFAFIILTPDDSGMGKYEFLKVLQQIFNEEDASSSEIKEKIKHIDDNQSILISQQFRALNKDRARQNVILEFGYFIGRIGRRKVCCLYQGDIERPSDMHGICYLHFNNSVNEVKETIMEELKAADLILS